VFEDGVAYVSHHQAEFDLIAVDSTDPVGPAADLFAGEFYRRVIRALRPGGVMTAQTESPHWNPDLVAAIYREMSTAFANVAAYACWIPTYPSGCWTMAYASPERRQADHFDEDRAAVVERSCRYYNRSLQAAAFAIPTFIRQAVYEGIDPYARYTREQHAVLTDDETR
jgi:spermidine synthase